MPGLRVIIIGLKFALLYKLKLKNIQNGKRIQ